MDEWERYRPSDEAEPSHDEAAGNLAMDDLDTGAPYTTDADEWGAVAPVGGQGFEALPEAEHRQVRESPARMTWQIVLALLGVGAFITLVLVWLDGAGRFSDNVALLVLTGVLFTILLVEVLLLRPVYDALFRRVPPGLPLKPEEDNFIVGCPGCGTVFTITQSELDAGSFGCHNCGRAGYIKDYRLNRSNIKDEVCRTCGNKYLEYMDHSECPICHSYNAY